MLKISAFYLIGNPKRVTCGHPYLRKLFPFMNKLSDICSMCRAARRNFHGNHLFREEIPPLPPPHLCLRHRVRLVALTIPKMTRLNWINFDKFSLNLKLSKIYISICYQAFWAVKLLFESKLWFTYSYSYSKSDCFSFQNTEVKCMVPVQRYVCVTNHIIPMLFYLSMIFTKNI